MRELDGDGDLLRAARVSIGALGVITAVTLRTVPAFTLRRVDEPRPLEEVLGSIDELAERNDHFEFFTLPHTETALVIERNRTDEPPRPRGRTRGLGQRRPAREPRPRAAGADRPPVSVREPRACALRGPHALPHREGRSKPRGVRLGAAGALHRDGVRAPARARARGAAAGRGADPLAAGRGLLPDRVPRRRRRRRPAEPGPRTPDGLHRRPPVRGDGVASLLRGGRGDHARLRRPPSLGQAPLPDCGDAGAALSAVGRLPARPRRARPAGTFRNEYTDRVLGPPPTGT